MMLHTHMGKIKPAGELKSTFSKFPAHIFHQVKKEFTPFFYLLNDFQAISYGYACLRKILILFLYLSFHP